MINLIAQIAAAIAALAGLVVLLWTQWLSPKAKARREAAKMGQKAADKGDTSAVTAAFDRLRRDKQ